MVRTPIFLLVGFLAVPMLGHAAPRQPNVIILLADDLGYGDVGAYGGEEIPTPNIDSLAKNGILCTNGYVSSSYCSPSRAGLMTGRYPTRFGFEFNVGSKMKYGLPVTETTLGDHFRKAGYVTGIVGKWHLGHRPRFHPYLRGFDHHFGFLGPDNTYLPSEKSSILRGVEEVDEKEYLTDAFGREAIAFIDRCKGQPFFLYVPFSAVHTPLAAPEKYLKRFESVVGDRKIFCAMTSALDDAIGNVLAKLREDKLEEDTLVFFLSDNGGSPNPIGVASNGPLNYFKGTTWEGGIRVPWMAQWKGRLPAGKVYDQPVIQLDIGPTALAAAGIEAKDAKFDGVNLLPFLEGKNNGSPHAALFWRLGNSMAVRMGDWKLLESFSSDGKKLFHLKDDIGEKTDVSVDNADRVNQLQSAWDTWNESNIPPLWVHDPLGAYLRYFAPQDESITPLPSNAPRSRVVGR